MIAGLILAGGSGRRLGGVDKALVRLDGETLAARVLDRLAGQVVACALSANGDPHRFAPLRVPVLGDGPFAGQGPLAGLLAGLDWAAAQGVAALLSVPCDTPLIPRDLARTLSPAPACAASLGQRHHLVALWPVAARQALRRLLAKVEARGVGAFAATLGMRAVAFSPVAFPGGAWDPFLNINTPDDLARAAAILRHSGSMA